MDEVKTTEAPAEQSASSEWKPKTKIGKAIVEGKITSIDMLFEEGLKVKEPMVIDMLLPNLENDVIFIGGSTGKGGGIRRTPFRRTTRMHKSGRRFRISAMVALGNKDGYLGLGIASGPAGKQGEVINKAINQAKLNIIPISRGCGSWECRCNTPHSLPLKVEGKSGSVKVTLIPAPKGLGLAINDEGKKLMRFAGISDIWCKTEGQTASRVNYVKAIYNALSKLNRFRYRENYKQAVSLSVGKGGLK